MIDSAPWSVAEESQRIRTPPRKKFAGPLLQGPFAFSECDDAGATDSAPGIGERTAPRVIRRLSRGGSGKSWPMPANVMV